MTEYDILNDFYLAYWEWLEIDAPEENKYDFHQGIGLCGNLKGFMLERSEERDWSLIERIERVVRLMSFQFELEGLSKEFPFGGSDIYFKESSEDTLYLNQDRRDWVGKQVEMLR